jgi:hypothetical protein
MQNVSNELLNGLVKKQIVVHELENTQSSIGTPFCIVLFGMHASLFLTMNHKGKSTAIMDNSVINIRGIMKISHPPSIHGFPDPAEHHCRNLEYIMRGKSVMNEGGTIDLTAFSLWNSQVAVILSKP